MITLHNPHTASHVQIGLDWGTSYICSLMSSLRATLQSSHTIKRHKVLVQLAQLAKCECFSPLTLCCLASRSRTPESHTQPYVRKYRIACSGTLPRLIISRFPPKHHFRNCIDTVPPCRETDERWQYEYWNSGKEPRRLYVPTTAAGRDRRRPPLARSTLLHPHPKSSTAASLPTEHERGIGTGWYPHPHAVAPTAISVVLEPPFWR